MVFGLQLGSVHVIYAGLVVGLLFVFQMLVGLRVIKFKGRTHMKVHRRVAWIMAVTAMMHAFMALVVYNGWRILS